MIRGGRGRRGMGPRATVQGFTLIEVMMALAVMTVGAVGLLSLQSATTRGNAEARAMTVANQVNQLWLERLRRDALRWTSPDPTALRSAAGPRFLRNAPLPGGGWSGWFAPVDPAPEPGAPVSAGFDYRGIDTLDPNEMAYCTHVNLRWVDPGQTLRADVRTFWHRRGHGTDAAFSDLRLFRGCAVGAEDGVTAELDSPAPRLHAVRGSVVLRWTRLPQ